LGELAEKLDTEKVINALRKSWAKMTPRGREAAMKLPLDEPERHLLKRALESETSIHS
jgi:hypothetical protein